MANAGLLTSGVAALHHEAVPAFRVRHRSIDIPFGQYHFEGPRATCVGGMATADFSLALLARLVDTPTARSAAKALNHRRSDLGPAPTADTPGRLDSSLAAAVDVLANDASDGGLVARAAGAAGYSVRQLQRNRRTTLGVTPLSLAHELRAAKAEHLLNETNLTVTENRPTLRVPQSQRLQPRLPPGDRPVTHQYTESGLNTQSVRSCYDSRSSINPPANPADQGPTRPT